MFWCTDDNKKASNYEDRLHPVASFATLEDFWAVYSHMKRLNVIPVGFDYLMFVKGVKPMWEEPLNKSGGKWLIRLKKGVLQILWERLVIAVIRGAFSFEEMGDDEITGCVASVRNGEDVISIWNKDCRNESSKNAIRVHLIEILKVPKDTIIEYRAHDVSLAHSHGDSKALH
jgi:translation initiation factor 4E